MPAERLRFLRAVSGLSTTLPNRAAAENRSRLRGAVSSGAVLLAAWALLALTAARVHAETSREFWPEFNAYLKLDPRARLYLLANYTYPEANSQSAIKGPPLEGVVGAHLDYSLLPVLRPDLHEQDWTRNRYLWVRAGYQYSHSTSAADAGSSYRENRGVFEMTGRTPPLTGQLEWVGRARWDWRNRNGANSSLYRLKLGAERQFDLRGHAAVPYVTAEAIYDTRSSSWDQQRYQVGSEFALDEDWRIEAYLESRNFSHSQPDRVLGFGLVLKYFH